MKFKTAIFWARIFRIKRICRKNRLTFFSIDWLRKIDKEGSVFKEFNRYDDWFFFRPKTELEKAVYK